MSVVCFKIPRTFVKLIQKFQSRSQQTLISQYFTRTSQPSVKARSQDEDEHRGSAQAGPSTPHESLDHLSQLAQRHLQLHHTSFENGENTADEDFAGLYTGDDTIAKAAHDIQSMSSLTSSVVEDDLVLSLLSRAPENPGLILQAVCQVALQRRRVSLWTSAIEKCCQDGVAFLSAQQVIDAIQCFGLESIQQEYVVLYYKLIVALITQSRQTHT